MMFAIMTRSYFSEKFEMTENVDNNVVKHLVTVHFLSALTTSQVLYNRTEHTQGFSFCFILKKSVKLPTHYFQTNPSSKAKNIVVSMLYTDSLKARYNELIRKLVTMAQII